MLKRNLLLGLCLFALIATVGLQLNVHAGPKGKGKKGSEAGVPMTMNFYTTVVDEQDLNTFYNTTGSCPGVASSIDNSQLTGDSLLGPATAYEFGPPWEEVTGLASSSYVHGADCEPSSGVCLGVKLNHNDKTLSIDTRGTLGPRTANVDFGSSCTSCALPGNPAVFGGFVTTPVFMSVFLDNPFTQMDVCSSRDCPEAQPAFVKLWFDDPDGDRLLTWRVDWPFVRVLRMSSTVWYVVADGCDGSQVTGLYRLHNRKKRPSVSFQGSYLMPFFIAAESITEAP